MRRRPRFLVLLLAVLLAGCWAVVPGYSTLGVPMSQEERNALGDEGFAIYMWTRAPEPPHVIYNPLVLLANFGASLFIDTVALVPILFIFALSADDDDDDDDDAQPRRKERKERKEPEPQLKPVAKDPLRPPTE